MILFRTVIVSPVPVRGYKVPEKMVYMICFIEDNVCCGICEWSISTVDASINVEFDQKQ